MRTAISYTRFSTPEQAKGHSFERQTKAAIDFCESNDLILSDKLEDLGKSGWSGENLDETAALGGLLKLVRAGKIPKGTVLIIENLDRLTRKTPLDAIGLFTEIIKAGIDIGTTQDRKIYSHKSITDNPTDLLQSILLFSRGHEESQTKSIRIKASWDKRNEKVSKGEFAKVRHPSWITSQGGKFELIKDRAQSIKLIFDLYLKGNGAYNVVKELNRQKIKPFGAKNEWTVKFIHNVLQNPATMGTCEFTNPPRPKYFPAVVTEEIFYRALAQRKENLNHKGRTGDFEINIYGGVCKCNKCGSNMVKYTCGKGASKKNYFVCANSKRGTCKYELVPFEKFNDVFLQVLNTQEFTSLLFSKEPKQTSSEAVKGRLAEVEKKIARISTAMLKSESDSPVLVNGLKGLELEKKELANNLEAEIAKKADKGFSKTGYQTFLHGAETKLKDKSFRMALRGIIRRYVDKIILAPDEFHIFLKTNNDMISAFLNKPKVTPFGRMQSFSLEFDKWTPEKDKPLLPALPPKRNVVAKKMN